MRNPERWRPSKYVMERQRLRASRDARHVAVGSRFITDIIARQYQRLIEAHARGRLLDLGSGAVPLYLAYRERVDTVTCVDWGVSPHSSQHIDVVADLNGPLPLDDGSFDTVILTDVLEHVYRPHVLIGEVSRLLAPRGKLLLGVPFFYWIHEAPNDYARYTAFMLRRLCEDCHLTVKELEATGGSVEILLDMAGKHVTWSSLLGALHAYLAPCIMVAPGIAAASRYSAKWFPQGYVLVAEKDGSTPLNV